MVYLKEFVFPSENAEHLFIRGIKSTCYKTFYPFGIISKNLFERIDFSPITILYGSNGSGKSTVLNIIAEKIGADRESVFNRSDFYGNYVDMCDFVMDDYDLNEIKIVTSDDVFDYILDIRNTNEGIDKRRSQLLEDYINTKESRAVMKSLDDYETIKHINEVRRKSRSKYINENLTKNLRTYSNGENAYRYFLDSIKENGIYILDEPENSLSPKRQIELVKFIEDSARFFGCQFIISTHSPFILSMKEATIYNMDKCPVSIDKWTELDNVREYYNFFMEHKNEFE